MVDWGEGRRVIMTLPIEEYTVKDAVKARKFRGQLLAKESTEKRDAPRWTTMELYKVAVGPNTGMYVLVVTGKSVLYHAASSACSSAVPTPWGELPLDAEPCRLCGPTMDDDIELEDDYSTVSECTTATEVIGHLQQQRGDGPPTLSRPAARLLRAAARIDPAFEPPVEQL
jgi:hypothetical protein